MSEKPPGKVKTASFCFNKVVMFFLLSFFGLSMSLLISRTIPNTLSQLSSNVSNQVSFKAADLFQQLPTEGQPLNLEQKMKPDNGEKNPASNEQPVSDSLDMQTNETDGVSENNEVIEKLLKNESQQSFYRVRKDWTDKKSQIGAFVKKENALELAKKNSGYKVYDPLGNEMNDLDLSNKSQTQKEIESKMLYQP